MMDWQAVIIILAVWNAAVFALYGTDKARARRKGRRISEKTLLFAAALMGAPGALLAMRVFRHKTRHTAFKIGLPLLLVLNIAAAGVFIYSFDMTEGKAQYIKLTPAEAKEMIENEKVILLDVRTEPEFEEGHIEGAVLIPDYELQNRAQAELPDKSAVILVYCRSGSRSENAAKILIELGYKNVYDMGGVAGSLGESRGVSLAAASDQGRRPWIPQTFSRKSLTKSSG